MKTPVQEKQAQVEALCARHGVARLELFGSAAQGKFEAGHSDLDFLVRFQPCTPEEHAERHLGLLADLQDLFGCGIDLVEIGAIRNPYFIECIEPSRTPVYAA
ncbi:MAG TPA: nucleotidyltransferase domain-containing protein [Candidatus Hydrogenedentes bacterium]|nr:nucleotidyltransferase domain-containing protein [Candidatus Hydrogenedentota bacterium]HPG69847.1 nucleotidyltransferase domain-containing protein [Candidatus Hydrogenedentota bacterium]